MIHKLNDLILSIIVELVINKLGIRSQNRSKLTITKFKNVQVILILDNIDILSEGLFKPLTYISESFCLVFEKSYFITDVKNITITNSKNTVTKHTCWYLNSDFNCFDTETSSCPSFVKPTKWLNLENKLSSGGYRFHKGKYEFIVKKYRKGVREALLSESSIQFANNLQNQKLKINEAALYLMTSVDYNNLGDFGLSFVTEESIKNSLKDCRVAFKNTLGKFKTLILETIKNIEFSIFYKLEKPLCKIFKKEKCNEFINNTKKKLPWLESKIITSKGYIKNKFLNNFIPFKPSYSEPNFDCSKFKGIIFKIQPKIEIQAYLFFGVNLNKYKLGG